MQKFSIVFMLALGTLLIAACGGPGNSEISVDMTEFSFTPSSNSVSAGSEVTVSLTNSGTLEHNWVVMEAGYTVDSPFDESDQANVLAETSVGTGGSSTFSFTAPSDGGTYQVVCSVPGHLEGGMQGSLSVTP